VSAMTFNLTGTGCWMVELTGRFSAPISKEHRDRLVDALATWNFKPHYLDDGDLYRVACILFDGILHSEGLADLQLERGVPSYLSPRCQLTGRSSQPLVVCHPSDIPRSEPVPQLRARHRRPASDVLFPHQHRSRSAVLVHPRFDAQLGAVDAADRGGRGIAWSGLEARTTGV